MSARVHFQCATRNQLPVLCFSRRQRLARNDPAPSAMDLAVADWGLCCVCKAHMVCRLSYKDTELASQGGYDIMALLADLEDECLVENIVLRSKSEPSYTAKVSHHD